MPLSLRMDFLSYLVYFSASIVLLAIFSVIYIILTPYDEIALIREGRGAAVVSLSGTLIGFSLTLAASAIYHADIIEFVIWGGVSMVVQLLGYLMMSLVIGDLTNHMNKNNVAVGAMVGLTGLVLGILNAGCLS